MLKLLSATPSPYARKVRIALIEKGIPFELVTEVPWNDGTATPKYNPLEKLPVLILPDGGSVYESDYILEWLEVHYPEPPIYPADPLQRLEARRMEVLVDGVLDAFVLQFFERMRPEGTRSQPWIDRQMRKVEGGLREIARLTPEQGFIVGNSFGLADICVGTLTAYLTVRFPEFDWRGRHPHLGTVNDRLAERPSFQASVPSPQVIDKAVV